MHGTGIVQAIRIGAERGIEIDIRSTDIPIVAYADEG